MCLELSIFFGACSSLFKNHLPMILRAEFIYNGLNTAVTAKGILVLGGLRVAGAEFESPLPRAVSLVWKITLPCAA